MRVDQFKLDENRLAFSKQEISTPQDAGFVLLFTSRVNLEQASWMEHIQKHYPDVPVVSCSSSGEIYLAEVLDHSISAVAVQFNKTEVAFAFTNIEGHTDSFEAGKALGRALNKAKLQHIFIVSDGWIVKGSQLIDGVYAEVEKGVSISGGMAGDGANFSETLVGFNDDIKSGNIVAIGFYGDSLQIGHGSHGGWNEYGDAMEITRSTGRIVYELDGKPALDLYKTYLGADADGLPGTALLYPVSLSIGDKHDLVRTVHSVDEMNNAFVLGEPVENGVNLRFMRAKFSDLLQGVEEAARDAGSALSKPAELSIVVSCIGRKLLLDQDIRKEIEITQNIIGSQTATIGFYSYGEISTPLRQFAQLHHQMMTVTSMVEL
jgi:hypothetical protein